LLPKEEELVAEEILNLIEEENQAHWDDYADYAYEERRDRRMGL
jgi:hypothetical protein